jgi:hypothetical protein
MLAAAFERFQRIGLDELNARAGLLRRRDNKYLLDAQQLALVLSALEPSCDLLDIDGRYRFRYESLYLDTEDRHCFRDHNQSRRHRLKLRFRRYADTLQTYFEVKLKDRGNQTQKYRQRMPSATLTGADAVLTPDLRRYLDSQLQRHPHRLDVAPYGLSMQVDYERVTLVSKVEPVRITLDNRLRFIRGGRTFDAGDGLWIMEVKSERGRSDVDRLLLAHRVRTVPRCSKYCVGLMLTSDTPRASRFTATANLIRRMS